MRRDRVSRNSGAARAVAGTAATDATFCASSFEGTFALTSGVWTGCLSSEDLVCGEVVSSLPASGTPQQRAAAEADFAWSHRVEQQWSARRTRVLRVGAPYATWTPNVTTRSRVDATHRFTATKPLDDGYPDRIQPGPDPADLGMRVVSHDAGG